MIALLPRLPASSKDTVDPKLPGQSKPLPGSPPAAPPAPSPNFAAWVTKALAELPDAAKPKAASEKFDAKPTTAASAPDRSVDPSTQNAAATNGMDPLPPAPPSAPPPKVGGHSAASPHYPVDTVTPGNTEARHPSAAPAANPKPSDPQHVAIKPQLPELATKPDSEDAAKSGVKTDGMTVAQNEERMKFSAEQNKIAGQATQKLPPVASITSAAAVKSDTSGAKLRLPVDFSPRDNSAEQLSLTTAKAATMSAPASAVASVHAPVPVDRVEQMIAREAITFKRSGADEIGVSLKIDAHTQLFLQLSYRDGQTQAVLRCEKGDLPALSAHFGQLQESLARQNIQLQSANNGSDLGRQGSSGRSQQDPAQKEEPLAKSQNKSTASTNPKTKPTSRRGWESWA